MLGYMSLAEVYRLGFTMKQDFDYSRHEYLNMLPYERDIELGLIIMDLEKKAAKKNKQ